MDLHAHAERCMADTNSILGEARNWMQDFLSADQQKNEVITALIKKLQDTEADIGQLKRDLSAEHKSRNGFQVEAELYHSQCKKLEQKIDDGSFIAVLIDGDGAKFADHFIRNPLEGGPRAAQALRQAVREHVMSEYPELDNEDIPILIRVYANLNDLAKSLRFSNVIDRDEDMKIFAEQLTNSRTEVDFVNVGRGKENADSKIRKMLSHYHKNLQCKKIFLACCHDNGYLHDLREYSDRAELNRKIVLVETTPAEPNFKMLGFPVTRFDGVFRTKGLDNETKHNFSMPVKPVQPPEPRPAPSLPPPVRQPSVPQNPLDAHRVASSSPDQQQQQLQQQLQQQQPQQQPFSSAPNNDPHGGSASVASETETASRTPSVVNSGNGGTSVSYATAGGNTTNHQNISLQTAKSRKLPKTVLYNFEGSRIDPPTTHPANNPAQGTYKTKLEKISPNAFCNDHYLVGTCRRTSCDRVHNVDLTPQEVSIHRYKARTSVCPRGPECDDYDCYLSHHCLRDPRCTRGNACRFTNTEFGNLHLDTNEKLKPAYV
ncbi:hypothetical protein JX265_011219 [Neoarthrinium moseri]|uniref:C3H1-type domain-containing protein n=1 Tax=Neoarthrinium moseri TaxID=1658444 RepID=A0A9Q0AHS2_9PEZI|nr:uncharacterized protein JN550_010525 [Neoarthrinium moseri]KAI1845886.1 hypothetical protein JX266_007973 [Neoarthrinium moseri]KAI1857484.1 hypothetical protein JX265_011219 [Neoarthrinium moseri]KAI1862060.1 hypothetical protein JN550_010525 [Neoarthrinium moseri]